MKQVLIIDPSSGQEILCIRQTSSGEFDVGAYLNKSGDFDVEILTDDGLTIKKSVCRHESEFWG